MSLDELPTAVQAFVRDVSALPSDPTLVAERRDMGYRLTAADDGHRLEHPSIRPPLPGRTIVEAASLEDACLLLVAALGDEQQPAPGAARHGLPAAMDAGARLERLRGTSIERLARAYLGEPDGVLDLLAPGAAVDLLDAGLVRAAEAGGWTVLAGDGPDGVRLTDVDVVLRREGDEHVVLRRPERQNDLVELHRSRDLDAARAATRAALR